MLREVTDDIESRQPDRFKRFFMQGESHTVLELPSASTPPRSTAPTLRDWTADFLTDGPAGRTSSRAPTRSRASAATRYAGDSLWLCRPGSAQRSVPHATTSTPPRSSPTTRSSSSHDTRRPRSPTIDCFYVYPTVDLIRSAGNHTDFTDISFELDPLLSQAARFNRVVPHLRAALPPGDDRHLLHRRSERATSTSTSLTTTSTRRSATTWASTTTAATS